jgi:ParB family transcriptional regulator, chromosome partitioning protein
MADDKPRLGKGLEAIFGENVTTVLEEIQRTHAGVAEALPLSEIFPNPYQPRSRFDETKLEELAQSIREHGVFTPILVRKAVSGYQLIAGERRLRAARKTDLTTIPAIILDFSDEEMMEISLIENIQREDLSAIEEAIAYRTLIDRLGLTQERLSTKVGKSRVHITNTLRLLTLPESVQTLVVDGQLTMGQVKPLITLNDPHRITELAQKILRDGLSAREAERLVKVKPSVNHPKATTDYRYAESLLTDKLQTKVTIAPKRVTITFTDDEDLNRILDCLGVLEDHEI